MGEGEGGVGPEELLLHLVGVDFLGVVDHDDNTERVDVVLDAVVELYCLHLVMGDNWDYVLSRGLV